MRCSTALPPYPAFYGDTIAFVAELAISFILMSTILFAFNHEVLAAFESPIFGPDVRPSIVCQPARHLDLFHGATPFAMLAAAEVLLLARERKGPYCATLHRHNDKRCIFSHSAPDPTSAARREESMTNVPN